MKAFVLFIFFAYPSVSLGACWEFVSKTSAGDSVFFVDKCSISTEKGIKKAWTKAEHIHDNTVEDRYYVKHNYDRALSLEYFDCKNKTNHIKSIAYYLKGEAVHSVSLPFNKSDFLDVFPDSIGESILDSVCLHGSKKPKEWLPNPNAFNSIGDEFNNGGCWETVSSTMESSIHINLCSIEAGSAFHTATIAIKSNDTTKKLKVITPDSSSNYYDSSIAVISSDCSGALGVFRYDYYADGVFLFSDFSGSFPLGAEYAIGDSGMEKIKNTLCSGREPIDNSYKKNSSIIPFKKTAPSPNNKKQKAIR